MAVLHHGHTHIFQSDSRSKPSETFCVVQFALFWIGFFALTYLASVLVSMVAR